MNQTYQTFLIRDWRPDDRSIAAELIRSVLSEFRICSEPNGADQDVTQVEAAYWATGGEFWVVEQQGQLVGTAGYYPVPRGQNAVEIRKMYLLPQARGQGLGRYLLGALEQAIAARGYTQIWLETATVLEAAVKLYERSGYQLTGGAETARCDRMYVKQLPVLQQPAS